MASVTLDPTSLGLDPILTHYVFLADCVPHSAEFPSSPIFPIKNF